MEITIPSASVRAKALYGTGTHKAQHGSRNKCCIITIQTAERAFKTNLLEDFTVLPEAISSRIRAKIITLASTKAIPIDR